MAPVLLGTAFAVESGGFHLAACVCALLGAVLIQVGTNYANDAADFERGADTAVRRGPLRVTQAGLVTAAQVKRAAALAFGLAFAAGIFLILRGGWPILVLGLAAIASGVAYTSGRYALAYTGLADVFALVFFGPVAVAGTYYVQALALPLWVVMAGLGPGFLATAILLANNVRDHEEDRAAGKKTLVVRFGRAFGVGLYVVCLAAAAFVPVALVGWTGGHGSALAAALAAVLLGWPLARLLRRSDDPAVLNPLLGRTARLLLVYCVAFGLGWLV